MIADRLRECLTILRWSDEGLAEEVGAQATLVRAWLSGRVQVPLVVAAWLETLVKAYRTTPHPRMDAQGRFVCSAPVDPAREIRIPSQQPCRTCSEAPGTEPFQIGYHHIDNGGRPKLPPLSPYALNGGNHESPAL